MDEDNEKVHWLPKFKKISPNVNEDQSPISDSCSYLDEKLIKVLEQEKIYFSYPVQKIVIPAILADANGQEYRFQPRDVCVAAPTGSGKTLSFVLPIIQVLKDRTNHSIQAVVILPVIELAAQVFSEFIKYSAPFNLKVGEAFGRTSFENEQKALIDQNSKDFELAKVDILVCTPGCLAQHVARTPGFNLSNLRYLVIDEADQMIFGDLSESMKDILDALERSQDGPHDMLLSRCFWLDNKGRFKFPKAPAQKLLFSATLAQNSEKLKIFNLFMPLFLCTETDIGKDIAIPSHVKERYIIVSNETKALVLYLLIKNELEENKKSRILIFANAIDVVKNVTRLLKTMAHGPMRITEFSSNIKNRQRILKLFQSGKVNILVSSDAMARGIDFLDVSCVICYEVAGKTLYTHRAGRTGRAGKDGRVISLFTVEELHNIKRTICKGFLKNLAEIKLPESSIEENKIYFEKSLSQMKSKEKSQKIIFKSKKDTVNKKRKKRRKSNK